MKSVRTTKLDTRTPLNLVLASSVADPGRFDADPDPTFQADADPDLDWDPDPKNFFQIFLFFFSIILHNFS